MTGVVLVVLAVVVVIPVGTLVLGAATAAALGTSLWRHGEVAHQGSELVDLNT